MNTVTVTVYSTPNCMQCRMTYRALDNSGIPYTVVDVTNTPAALEYITDDLGYSQAPVVVIDEGENQPNHWSGFRPDLITKLHT